MHDEWDHVKQLPAVVSAQVSKQVSKAQSQSNGNFIITFMFGKRKLMTFCCVDSTSTAIQSIIDDVASSEAPSKQYVKSDRLTFHKPQTPF